MRGSPNMAQPAAPRRRQNKSCDQCRLGKRKCDVQVSVQHVRDGDSLDFCQRSGDHQISSPLASSPCSNCKKWKKRCTIDWIRSHQTRQFTTSLRPRKAKSGVYAAENTRPEDAWYAHLIPEDVEATNCDRLTNPISNESGQDGFNVGPTHLWFNNISGQEQNQPNFFGRRANISTYIRLHTT